MRRAPIIGGLALLSFGLPACTDDEAPDTEGETDVDTDIDVDTDADTDGVEIAYDDGTAEEYLAPETPSPHPQVAVLFTAVAYPADLVGARFWIGTDGEPGTEFDVQVYAADGNEGKPGTALLAKPITTRCLFGGGNHWAEADLSSAGLTVTEDFFVAMDWTTPPGDEAEDAQFLGADWGEPDQRTYWKWSESTKWMRIESVYPAMDRDAMIRATVRY